MNATEEKAQQINDVDSTASTIRDDLNQNGAETESKSGTPPTQLRSRRVRGKRLVKAAHKMQHGQVYFVRAGDAIKIGFTTATTSRIASLQTSNAATLELLGTAPGTEQDERYLHVQFHHLHLRGEWFTAGPDLIDHIERHTEQGKAAAKARAKEARERYRSTSETRGLLVMRSHVGFNTPIGYRCSNIDEAFQNRQSATGDQLKRLDASIAIWVRELAALSPSITKGER